MSALNEIHTAMAASLALELGYTVDPDLPGQGLAAYEAPADLLPTCWMLWGDEVEDDDEDVPTGYFQAQAELHLQVLLPAEQAGLQAAVNDARAEVKLWIGRHCQDLHPQLVEIAYLSSGLGRTGRDTPPVGGLEVRLGVRYREPRKLPGN